MIGWGDDIVTSIARRRAVLFLGAGVSRNALSVGGNRPPLWKTFLEQGIEKCAAGKSEMRRALRNNDYLTCCQLIKYQLAHEWIPFLEEKFSTPDYKSGDIHKHIFNLDAGVVLTPNFDRIYDNYAISTGGTKVKIKKYNEDDISRNFRNGDVRLILKVHGCIDSPGKLVFTREDYADVRNKHASFYRAVESLILTNTVIFIGCGMSDPDINLLLEQYARSFADSPPHYFITSSKLSGELKRMMKDNYNLVAIEYSDRNEHKELVDSLEHLVELVDERRSALAGTRLW